MTSDEPVVPSEQRSLENGQNDPVKVWYLGFQQAIDSVNGRMVLWFWICKYNTSSHKVDCELSSWPQVPCEIWWSVVFSGKCLYWLATRLVFGNPAVSVFFINHLAKAFKTFSYLFAGDVNVVGNSRKNLTYWDLVIKCVRLPRWGMPLNTERCGHPSTRGEGSIRLLKHESRQKLHGVSETKDLWMNIDMSFTPSTQCAALAVNANQPLEQLGQTVHLRVPRSVMPL